MNYHFGSKDALLLKVAERLRDERHQSRIDAMAQRGSTALDALWQVLSTQVASGRSGAWLALLSNPSTGGSVQPTETQIQAFLKAVGEALGMSADRFDPQFLLVGLEGVEVRLLSGAQPRRARESYDRFWLAILNDDLSQA